MKYLHTILLLVTQVLPYHTSQDARQLSIKLVNKILKDGRAMKQLYLYPLNLELDLKPVNTLISPRYSMWIRNGLNVSVHRTIPFPTCLFEGQLTTPQYHIQVSLSLCSEETVGVVEINGEHHLIEKVNIRTKRESVNDDNNSSNVDTNSANDTSKDTSGKDDEILVVRKTDSEHSCGVNTRNRKRLKVDPKPIIKLDEINPYLNLTYNRVKRSTTEYYIELSVFVDEKMYKNIDDNKKYGEDTLQKIQTLVYGYLNGVQIIYKSARLTRRLKIVLVRLDILQSPDKSLDNHSGETEKYLDSFCKWQMDKNPGGNTDKADISNDEHWDHALLLTGFNLYDSVPALDAVIGLAWVSGMCHPQYSCTINEGNNFESVFVIAHEMGHNLGMNHDGEISEGNSCSANKYLMSPVLGPGKVTWSKCSDNELTNFLTGSFSSRQAACLKDVPSGSMRYDYSFGGKLPGEKFTSSFQCHQAYGITFVPYLRDESPFEDLCRELWCSNLTHALRAHPALEGTDCSSKPFPYGSVCVEGVCTPWNPDKVDNVEDNKSLEPSNTLDNQPTPQEEDEKDEDNSFMKSIDGTPAWYDPIYNKIFTDLRKEFAKRDPILQFASESNDRKKFSGENNLININNSTNDDTLETKAALNGDIETGTNCSVACGGGWIQVFELCGNSTARGCQLMKPCGIIPCL